jgi:hypothetical protein
MLGPSSTDAVNRASRLTYGEATGITQTVRNYAASMGLAILGTILVTEMRSHLTTSLISLGLPSNRASAEAAALAESHGSSGTSVSSIPHFYRVDFAQSTQTVLYVMAGIMAAAAIVAILGLRAGVQKDIGGAAEDASAQEAPAADEPASPPHP